MAHGLAAQDFKNLAVFLQGRSKELIVDTPSRLRIHATVEHEEVVLIARLVAIFPVVGRKHDHVHPNRLQGLHTPFLNTNFATTFNIGGDGLDVHELPVCDMEFEAMDHTSQVVFVGEIVHFAIKLHLEFEPRSDSRSLAEHVHGDFVNPAGVNNTRITFSKSGVYTLNFSLSFKNTTNDGQTIDVWFRYNGTDVVNSNSRFFVSARKSTGDPSYLIAVTAYTGIAQNDNDYVEIMWRVSDINVTMEHLPAVTASPGVTPAIPATPSAIVQANFVSAEYPPVTRVAPLPVFGFGQVGAISVVTR